jgi:hypothetical protein
MGPVMNERGVKWVRTVTLAGLAVVAGVVLADWWTREKPTILNASWRVFFTLNADYPGFSKQTQRDLQVLQEGQGTQMNELRLEMYFGNYFAQRANPLPGRGLTPLPAWDAKTRKLADDALADIFTCQDVTAKVPRTANGGLDWNWQGPRNDPEFAWVLNRLTQLPALYVAWKETGQEKYRTAMIAQWWDWIVHNPRPWHYSWSGPWRALEAARRVEDAWLPILLDKGGWEAVCGEDVTVPGSEDGGRITPELLLASFKEQAECLRDTHSGSGNHLISEMTGLATVALAFPEFKDAPGWLDYALGTTQRELTRQFYPDGAHTELANSYQLVTLEELQQLMDTLTAAGRDAEARELRPGIEAGWNYFTYVMSPRGSGPMDNDSDYEFNALWVRGLAGEYGRGDWLYVATGGREGTAPALWPTQYFGWAGQAVMRSGWRAHDQWAFFQGGPYGSDHQHDDRLQLDVSGEGRDFFVDNGRYTYEPGPWREYFAGVDGHNGILLDGRGPMRPPDVGPAEAQMRHEMGPALDFFSATAAYAGDWLSGQGPAYHTRAVLYARGEYWIVADRILTAGGPRRLEALWHFHPECSVRTVGNLVYTDDAGKGNLGMLAVNGPKDGWGVELVRGREGSKPQGWYSPNLNLKSAATCAEFTTMVAGPRTYVWVIWTEAAGRDVKAGQPLVRVEEDSAARLRLSLDWPGGKTEEATVPFAEGEAAKWERTAGS